MSSLDSAVAMTATVARGANLSSATALQPPSTSGGIGDSTGTSIVAADFTFEAE